jgi:ATP-dependent helicase/nuclease subunit A
LSQHNTADWQGIYEKVLGEYNLNPASDEPRAWYRECCELMQDETLAEIFHDSEGAEILNEVPVIYRHDDSTVHGIIDRLILTPEEVWVVDYKTHHYADRYNLAELAERYYQQIAYYARGLKLLWPNRDVRGFVLFTAPRLLYEIPLNDVLSRL